MNIGIGSDHWGVGLKAGLIEHFADYGLSVVDFGTSSSQPVDYPDIAELIARAIVARTIDKGILICRTGLGMAIAANKVPGVYAATVHSVETARAAAASNNAQVITLGSDGLGQGEASAMVREWLRTPFKGGPSALKVGKIHQLEAKYSGYQIPREG